MIFFCHFLRGIYVSFYLFLSKFVKSYEKLKKFPEMKLNFQKLDIEIPVEIPVNFMILTGTGIPANRLILTGTGILPGSRSILESFHLTIIEHEVKVCFSIR